MSDPAGIKSRIAFLGWGSLVWDDDRAELLPVTVDEWLHDGPQLPVEFRRISGRGKNGSTAGYLSLVIDPDACDVPTLWNLSARQYWEQARDDLRKREGSSLENIGTIVLATGHEEHRLPQPLRDRIHAWALEKQLSAVIWTDLCENFACATGGDPFTCENVIKVLRNQYPNVKIDRGKAEQYIRRAPAQVRTAMRDCIERELGWTPR